jgi:hypothetical protein
MNSESCKNIEIQNINFSSEEEEEEEVIQVHIGKWYIQDGQNPFEFYNKWEFKRRFRFSKHLVMFGILPLIESGLTKTTNHGLPISPVLQLLICLRFYSQVFRLVIKLYYILIKLIIKYSNNFFSI